MAHFAKVIDNVVQQVIVAEQDFINKLPDKDKWIQTSYNTHNGKHYAPNSINEDDKPAVRGNFAGIGMLIILKKIIFMMLGHLINMVMNVFHGFLKKKTLHGIPQLNNLLLKGRVILGKNQLEVGLKYL